jgi:urease accessory protein
MDVLADPIDHLPGQRMRGRLDLRFAAVAGRTVATALAQAPPLQMVRSFGLADGAALVHLHNIAGGVLAGDDLAIAVEVAPGAQAQLTTTGANRIYRSRDGAAARQRTRVDVGAGGLLEYLPDPTIPFAGAVYEQATRIDLAADAGLCWWEVLAPGRSAAGESFAYRRLRLDLDLWAAGRPIAIERLLLEPAERPLSSRARMGGYTHLASGYLCRVGPPPERWLELEAGLARLAQELSRPGAVLWGVSALPAHGLLVRGLATSSAPLSGAMLEFWGAAKRELYGRSPNVPRKVY